MSLVPSSSFLTFSSPTAGLTVNPVFASDLTLGLISTIGPPGETSEFGVDGFEVLGLGPNVLNWPRVNEVGVG